jgi:hypothetical protein
MYAICSLRSMFRGRLRASWRTHLYIVAVALLVQAPPSLAQAPGRELLNSERIAAAFGSYGVEVLEQDDQVRVSSLFSLSAEEKTCRTFAVVRYPSQIDPAVRAEHAQIVAGGSIGAVFAAHGWGVRKAHLSYAERSASSRLASLMHIDVGTPLAEHVYVLDVVKDGRAVEYAALVEIHHPDYLDLDDLAGIYGPVDENRKELATLLRATATDRTR